MTTYVSPHWCVSRAFPLALFLLFVVSLYPIILDAYLCSKERRRREGEVWIWVGQEVEVVWEAQGRGSHNQNMLCEKNVLN